MLLLLLLLLLVVGCCFSFCLFVYIHIYIQKYSQAIFTHANKRFLTYLYLCMSACRYGVCMYASVYEGVRMYACMHYMHRTHLRFSQFMCQDMLAESDFVAER